MKALVIDLDGTLSDSTHRQHLAKAALWDEFHELGKQDKPHEDVQQLIGLISCALEDKLEIIICTARPEKYRQQTLEWLDFWSIPISVLLMRPDNDYTHTGELKIRMLEEHFGSKELIMERVICVLDDRDKVIESMRNYGLSCWQVRPSGY